jgi:hypothetical protein
LKLPPLAPIRVAGYSEGMPKQSSKSRKPKADPVEAAHDVLRHVIGLSEGRNEPAPEKNPAAVALGRLGGLKGGKARAKKLSARKRSEIAKAAAAARWNGHSR